MSNNSRKQKNVIKYHPNKKIPNSSNNRVQQNRRKKKGIVPKIQFHLRKGYIYYRRVKADLKKSKDFSKFFDKRNLVIGGSLLCILFVFIFTVWFFTHKNSYEVILGSKSIGFIAMNKAVTQQILQDSAVTKLSAELGSNVQVNEVVNLTPVHSSKSKQSTIDYVVGEIYKNFTYKVEACTISIDGIEITALKSQSEADELLNNIIKSHKPEDLSIVESESGFLEKVETSRKYVESSEIESKELAYSKLTAVNSVEQHYVSKSGDNLWSIAAKNNMKTDELIKMNPEISDPTKLKVGQTLTILRPVPLLSVKIVLEEKKIEVDLRKEQLNENPNQPATYKNVIQEGKDGQKEVTYHITKINGIETDRTAVFERNTIPSEPYIVEVGTKK